LRVALCFLLLAGSSALAEPPVASMADYTTCAVYHRMMVGAFQRGGRDMGIMADMEREKMDLLIRNAKLQAREEYGDDLAEELFQEEWRATLADMTNQINRNYENVSRLKYRYKNRCSALHEKASKKEL
jgi:hypothetical protein